MLSKHKEEATNSDTPGFARDTIYRLKIVQIFVMRKHGIRIPRRTVDLFVPSEMMSAFLRLNLGEKYLLTGRIGSTGKLRMNLCNWHERWAKVTPLQRKRLFTGKYVIDFRRQQLSVFI